MKTKYIVGFFAAFLIMTGLLCAGYQISYRYVMDRQAAQAQETPAATESVPAEGDAVKDEAEKTEGYYLCELHGFVVVYYGDKTTIFEMTEIPLSDLPRETQNEVADGKYIKTMEELYAFLENYSS